MVDTALSWSAILAAVSAGLSLIPLALAWEGGAIGDGRLRY